jgi:hypothetical protein
LDWDFCLQRQKEPLPKPRRSFNVAYLGHHALGKSLGRFHHCQHSHLAYRFAEQFSFPAAWRAGHEMFFDQSHRRRAERAVQVVRELRLDFFAVHFVVPFALK